MKRFWARNEDDLARELREQGPQVSDDFVRSLTVRIDPGARRTRLYVASRLSFVGAITVLVLGVFASFGGIGYAASTAKHVAVAAKHVVAPQSAESSAAQDQYRPEKVTICHKGHTITISRSALPAHLRHGDTVGPCPSGGVLGASATASRGNNGTVNGDVAGVITGSLPFTGISLGATMLLSLILITCGIALRRRAGRSS